jgi:CoA:oxalate CoA-transferase
MLPLSGIRVIDWTVAVAGPFAGMVMAELGADVIHIERPGPVPQGSPPDCGRNKRNIPIDLRSEEGKEILRKLLKNADVFLENFSLGATDEMGFSYEEVLKLNPRIIYITLKGYGDGPYELRPAYDPDIESETGVLRLSGLPGEEPVRLPGSVIDKTTGIWCAFYTILSLIKRESTGKGQYIKVGMYEDSALLTSQNMVLYQLYDTLLDPAGMGSGSARYFETLNSWIYLGIHTDDEWKRFCRSFNMNIEDELELRTMAARDADPNRVEKIIQVIFSKMTTEHLLKKLTEAGIPCAPVNTMQEVISDPHLNDNGSIVILTPDPKARRTSVATSMLPYRTGDYNPSVKGWGGKPEPWNGQDTIEILRELGYMEDQIIDFRKRKIVYPYQ